MEAMINKINYNKTKSISFKSRNIEVNKISKEFHIGDILSITTGTNLSPTGEKGIKKLIEFLTQSAITDDTIFKKAAELKPLLLKKFQKLKNIDPEVVMPHELKNRVKKIGQNLYGSETIKIETLKPVKIKETYKYNDFYLN